MGPPHQTTPRPHGLEAAFKNFGVAPKQTDKARRAFENSAPLAGFFDHGDDKLVEPINSVVQRGADAVRKAFAPIPNGKSEEKPANLSPSDHPFIQGLLLSLPPVLGETWSMGERIKWLQAAAAAFDLMFKGDGIVLISDEPEGKTGDSC